MPRRGRHRVNVGVSGRQGPYIKYGYTSASHVPGHVIDRYGRSRYLGRRRKNAYMNPRTGGFLGIELKFLDTSRGLLGVAVNTDATGGEQDPATVNSLSSVAQGDGEQNRDGRQCIFKSIFVSGVVEVANQLNQTAAHPASIVFIALVLDTQTNGTQLNSEDVYKNIGGTAMTLPYVMRNLQFIKRFKILATKRIVVQRPTLTWDGTNMEMGGLQVPWSMYKKLNIQANYSGTTAVITNSTDNSLHIVAFSSSSSLVPRITYNSRLRFVG